jgi:LysR family transcriptional regulator, glycine cleavage system transcriptional activator
VKLPPMNTLHAFCVAARKLNFSQAGEELNITHAAVSNQMKRLEQWFGRKLFERAGRGLKLTPAGQDLLRTVDSSLLAISAASERIRITRGKKSISIACLPSVATRWLVPVLADFLQAHPRFSVELSYAEAMQEFDGDHHDVLITHLVDLPANAEPVRIFNRTSKPVASIKYVGDRRSDLAGQLEGARLLHDASTQAWEDWFKVAGFRPSNITHGPVYPDFNMLFTAVLSGHGVALCPVEVFRNEIARGELVVLSDFATQTAEGYYIVTEKQPPHAVTQFVTWFQERIARPSAP